jgi:transcriptional regulator with XRE-family HTH domain
MSTPYKTYTDLLKSRPKLARHLASREFDFRESLVAARKASGLSQADVATRIGGSQRWVADFENYRVNISLSELRNYCLAVGIFWNFEIHFEEELS